MAYTRRPLALRLRVNLAHVSSRYDWTRRDVVVEPGLRLATFEAGVKDGPPIVLVHGIGHWTQAAWNPLMRELAGEYRLLAFDLPGFGDSDKPDATYDVTFYSRVLRGFVDSLALERFALVGNSLGGLIAAQFAGEHPGRVAALVLIAPAGFLRTVGLVVRTFGLAPLLEYMHVEAPRWFVRHTLELATNDPSVLTDEVHERAYDLAQDRHVRRAFGRVYGSHRGALFDMPRLHAEFARYVGPAQLLWGRHDNYLPIAGLETARRVYPQAGVTILERCGHIPQVEEPATVAAVLRPLYPIRR